MGQEILYCFKCQTRIVGADFNKGAAYEVGNHVCCSKCAAELLNTLAPKDREQLLAQMFKATQERKSGSTGTALPAMGAPLSSSSTRMRTPAASPASERRKSGDTARRLWSQQSRSSMTFAALGVAVLAVVVVLMLHSGGKTSLPGTTTKTLPPAVDPGAPVPESEELRKARDFARSHPQDIDGQIAAWQSALVGAERTPGADAAQKELERLRILQKDAIRTALQVLEVQTKPYRSNEEFLVAADILRSARGKFAAPEWTQEVDRRIDETRAAAVALLPALKTQAADAFRRKAEQEVRTLQARVRKWGHPDLIRELESVLVEASPLPPTQPLPAPAPLPASSKELETYLPRWEAALSRAAAGDPAGASQELSLALQGLTDAGAKAQGNEDLDALRRIGAAMEEIRDAVARTPKAQKISLERWNAAGVPEKLEGTAAGSEPGRLLLRTDAGILPVEIGELTPGAIADFFAARPAKKPGDERTVALLALLGGDPERVAKLKVEVPERWSKFAGKAASAVMTGREADARRLFVEAEDASGDPLRIATTLANYKSLLADYGTTALVVRNRAMLAGRPNLGKEYLFLPDALRGAGSFGLAKAGKMESAWLSDRDSDAASIAQNYVELGFTALPDLDYRLWIYAGGCCLETFSFGVQGTDMVLPTARTTAAEPGGAASIPIRPPLSLKKTHAAHMGPKSPARWDWIPVPLPKYSSPGVKVVRILTDQQGFAVAYASVSALTSNSPRDSELRELEKSRSRRPTLTEKDIPGLIAYWCLDEGRGGTVNDAVGQVGAGSIQGATWTSGRNGSGLHFDGDNSYVDLPNPPELDRIAEGNYSVMAWFKPDDAPSGKDDQNNAGYAIVIKLGHHLGLSYGRGGGFGFMNWLGKNEDPDHWSLVHAGTRDFPPGLFYHVAGSFNQTAGRSQIYVNGRLERTETFDPGSHSVSNIRSTWKLGIGAPGYPNWRWCAKGVIDEVRFYNRALSAAEIDAVYRMAAPSPSPAARSPADARPWKPVFDGKTMSLLNPACLNAWQLKEGCIANVPGVDNAAQTSEEFGDGDLRIRLESRGNSALWFSFRQSGPVSYGVNVRQVLGEATNQGEHVVIFSCRGSVATATIDGKPVRVDTSGTPLAKGVVQFNCSVVGSLRIRSIEFREPK